MFYGITNKYKHFLSKFLFNPLNGYKVDSNKNFKVNVLTFLLNGIHVQFIYPLSIYLSKLSIILDTKWCWWFSLSSLLNDFDVFYQKNKNDFDVNVETNFLLICLLHF